MFPAIYSFFIPRPRTDRRKRNKHHRVHPVYSPKLNREKRNKQRTFHAMAQRFFVRTIQSMRPRFSLLVLLFNLLSSHTEAKGITWPHHMAAEARVKIASSSAKIKTTNRSLTAWKQLCERNGEDRVKQVKEEKPKPKKLRKNSQKNKNQQIESKSKRLKKRNQKREKCKETRNCGSDSGIRRRPRRYYVAQRYKMQTPNKIILKE